MKLKNKKQRGKSCPLSSGREKRRKKTTTSDNPTTICCRAPYRVEENTVTHLKRL